jgi:resuscitation-promoting factor RpfA
MNRPSEPFNAEERDLAQRLARLGGPREPAPALDASILAAARAAVAEPAVGPATDAPANPKVTPLRPRKPGPRWPLGMGLAASLVLAAGIGWKLQGDGEGSSAESAVASAPVAAAEDITEAVILDRALEQAPLPPPPLAGASDAVVARRANSVKEEAKVAPEAFPQVLADAPVEPVAAAAPAAPPPPAPAVAQSTESDASLDKVDVSGSRIKRAGADAGAAEYTRTPLHERREQARKAADATGAAAAPAPEAQPLRTRGVVGASENEIDASKRRDDDGYDDSPPVSADSPAFRQAWLQRIREHIAKGEQDAARNSLQEFRRRYPDLELPEDLRKLAATLPAP